MNNNHLSNDNSNLSSSSYVEDLNHSSLVSVVSNHIMKNFLSDVSRETLIRIVNDYMKNNLSKDDLLGIIRFELSQDKIREELDSYTYPTNNDFHVKIKNIKTKEQEKAENDELNLANHLGTKTKEQLVMIYVYESFLVEFSNSYDLNLWQDTLGSLITGLNEESEEMGKEITSLLLLLFKLDKSIQLFDGTIKGFFRGDHKDIFSLFKNRLQTLDPNDELVIKITDSIQEKYDKTRKKMIEEMGDIYSYFTLIRLFFDISIEEIINNNEKKLKERWRNNEQLRIARKEKTE